MPNIDALVLTAVGRYVVIIGIAPYLFLSASLKGVVVFNVS